MVPMMAWLLLRVMSSVPEANQGMPDGMTGIMVSAPIVITAFLFIALPSALVLFYRSRHVKVTCELRDPVRRWIDICPLPSAALGSDVHDVVLRIVHACHAVHRTEWRWFRSSRRC